jgi:ankyrin repeat protein
MLLEEFKANVDCTDARNNTPLHYAIMNGNLKLVRVLFSKFPRIDISNEEGQTAFNL